MQTLTVLVVLGFTLWIFSTTHAGKRLMDRMGLDLARKQRAKPEDHDYLLRVCGGDFDELQRRLAEARRHNPEMSEAEAYRKAIRAHLRDKA